MEPLESPEPLSRRQEKRLLCLANEVTREEFQNSDRTNCPSPEDLRAAALRKKPLGEVADVIEHMGLCSACFNDYWGHRAEYKRIRRVKLVALCVVLAAASVATVRVVTQRKTDSPGRPETIANQPGAAQALVVDLRRFSGERSEAPAGAPQTATSPVRLPRGRLTLSILLPLGSDDEEYDVELRSDSGAVLLSARGQTRLENSIDVLSVELDTRSVGPGRHELALRAASASWRRYPLAIE